LQTETNLNATLRHKQIGIREFMLYIVDAAEQEPLRLFADKVMPAINAT